MTASDFATIRAAILRTNTINEAGAETGISVAEFVEGLLEQAQTSTIPVLVLTDAIEGRVPGAQRLDFLTSFARSQFEHYSHLMVLDPKLGPYEALGRLLSGTAAFQELSAYKSDREFIVNAWIRANPERTEGPLDAIVEHYVSQLEYFGKLYQRVALSKSEAGNLARGAVFGQIFGIVASNDENSRAGLARQFLRDAAAGAGGYGFPLNQLPRTRAA